jgi:hypothetical protein
MCTDAREKSEILWRISREIVGNKHGGVFGSEKKCLYLKREYMKY